MQANANIDFSTIDWHSVSEEKAKFIYNEAIEHHQGIIANNNRISDKALGMLSFTMPVMAALVGYFAISWGNVAPSLFLAAVSACVFLFGILFLLLLIIIPRGINEGAGSPSAYFTDDYYKRNMRELYVGNIVNIQSSIAIARKVMKKRGLYFKIAVILCAVFPAVSFLAFLFGLRC